MSAKSQIGHLALMEALSHERSCFTSFSQKRYINGEYQFLKDFNPDAYESAIKRWEKASAFADRVMAAYLAQVEGSQP